MRNLKTTKTNAHDDDMMGVRRIAQTPATFDPSRGGNAEDPYQSATY